MGRFIVNSAVNIMNFDEIALQKVQYKKHY